MVAATKILAAIDSCLVVATPVKLSIVAQYIQHAVYLAYIDKFNIEILF